MVIKSKPTDDFEYMKTIKKQLDSKKLPKGVRRDKKHTVKNINQGKV